MTVRTRLILTMLGISALLAAPAIYSAGKLKTLREIAAEQRTGVAGPFRTLGRLQTALAEVERFARSYIATPNDELLASLNRSIAEARTELAALDTSYHAQAGIAVAHVNAIETAMRNAAGLVAAGRETEGTDYLEQVKPLFDKADRSLEGIADAIDAQSRLDMETAERISAGAGTTTVLALISALAAAIALGVWTIHALTNPLRRLRRALASVASGEFFQPEDLPYDRSDEIGDLARSFSWMTQRLSQLDKMKAEFIGIATHELKTPINVITGYTELVEEGLYGEVTSDQKNALRTIREQSQVLTRLVNQLLDISRLEAGGLQLERGEVVVEDLLESLNRSFSILASKKNITLEFKSEASTPRMIHADPDRLRDQVLGNLLSNALKFTPEGGRISVKAWGADGELQLEVTDSGVGIPKDQVPYVFDKYYQIGQQARSKGVGLGLAIAREIVEAHGGKIWIQSGEGGTCFRISVPIEHAATSDAPSAPVNTELPEPPANAESSREGRKEARDAMTGSSAG